MSSYLTGSPLVGADVGDPTPDQINPLLLKDISKFINPIVSKAIPPKRSRHMNVVLIIFQACVQLLGMSPRNMEQWMYAKCKTQDACFQNLTTRKFSNKKERKFFPELPAFSRYHERLRNLGCTEDFWNLVLLCHFLYLKGIDIVKNDIKIIACHAEESCKKKVEDSYCFGKKEGKTVHETLIFSIISGEIHQVIANYKIKKRQDKLPLFEEIIESLEIYGFNIVYAILDRGFYRKRLLKFFKQKGIGVIMPGRKWAQTARKILN